VKIRVIVSLDVTINQENARMADKLASLSAEISMVGIALTIVPKTAGGELVSGIPLKTATAVTRSATPPVPAARAAA
jgi:hypothetical protein